MPAAVLPENAKRVPRLVRARALLHRQRQRWAYHHRRGQLRDADEMMARIRVTCKRLDDLERADEAIQLSNLRQTSVAGSVLVQAQTVRRVPLEAEARPLPGEAL